MKREMCKSCGSHGNHHRLCPRRRMASRVRLNPLPTKQREKSRKVNRSVVRSWNVGEYNPKAKLTDAEVREVLRMRRAGAKLSEIARKFRISVGYSSCLCAGKFRFYATPMEAPDAETR